MCCKPHECVITAEALTNAAQIPLPAGINERIAKNVVTAIWVPRSGSNTLYTDKGVTVAADTVLAGAHLHLKTSGGTDYVIIPMWLLMRDFNAPEPLRGKWVDIDVSQSYIQLNTSATGYNAAHAIEISFGYDCDKC